MPWKEYTVEKSRMAFLTEVLAGERTFTSICQEYGISRKTGYKWLKRHLDGENLRDKTKRPFTSPNKIPLEVEQLIADTRAKYPYWGRQKT